MDQQNSHGQPSTHSQSHDIYVHGNNTAASAGIADPQYHTHSHMHRKLDFFLSLRSFTNILTLDKKKLTLDKVTRIGNLIDFGTFEHIQTDRY